MDNCITRFPPEPNGYLHLGHLKAMIFDFNYNPNCQCILRMDDTNPETEKEEYVNAIMDDVKWLGFNPVKITYTSDYFDRLIEYAFILVKKGLAHVDLSEPSLIKEQRRNGIESEYRNKEVSWHLTKFEQMVNGFFKQNEAVLRLKIDMQNNNHTLRDPIAYRVKLTPHYRTGTKYKIYPSYDYSHGIVDSLENIKYSYCTMEYYIRRDLYYWPLKQLSLYEPIVMEFGRLNVENNVLSKRKIIELIKNNHVDGFDDPRLLTICGLRRRGFTPEILKNILSGCTMDRNEITLSQSFIEHNLRNFYDQNAKRMFAVLEPYRLEIANENNIVKCEHPNHPVNKSMGSHFTLISKNVYINGADFREVDDKDYYRLAPGKIVRLKYSYFVKYVNHTKECIIVEKFESVPNPKKIKGVINWVSEEDSVPAKFVFYDSLFNGDAISTQSKTIRIGRIEKSANTNDTIQFERLGYFRFSHYDDDIPIFINVISLKDLPK